MTASVFSEDDDQLHSKGLGDDWWATETSWFSFHNSERKLGGWFYSMFRPNIGTVAGGAWLWDDSAHLPWEVLYNANYTALQMDFGVDLRDCELPTGLSIKVLKPTMDYSLVFNDADRLQTNLTFSGVMPPEPLTSAQSTFGKAKHFDQLGRVHGTVTLHGEVIPIDCISMRDRTWGRRPENRPRQAAYVTGASDSDNGFLAVTSVAEDKETISFGFLRREGRTVGFAEGLRLVERDSQEGWVKKVIIEGIDRDGRKMLAEGTPVSRIIINRHSFIDINSLIRWNMDGVVAWGEDQDMWPVHRWSRNRRLRETTKTVSDS